jgi:uncharacterized protein (UPF0297 family)
MFYINNLLNKIHKILEEKMLNPINTLSLGKLYLFHKFKPSSSYTTMYNDCNTRNNIYIINV